MQDPRGAKRGPRASVSPWGKKMAKSWRQGPVLDSPFEGILRGRSLGADPTFPSPRPRIQRMRKAEPHAPLLPLLGPHRPSCTYRGPGACLPRLRPLPSLPPPHFTSPPPGAGAMPVTGNSKGTCLPSRTTKTPASKSKI